MIEEKDRSGTTRQSMRRKKTADPKVDGFSCRKLALTACFHYMFSIMTSPKPEQDT
jgi:hypothetical protein